MQDLTVEQLSVMSDDELREVVKKCDTNISLHIKNNLFRRALRSYVVAQGRMLNRWSEGDDRVKADLWKDLHACEHLAREVLEIK